MLYAIISDIHANCVAFENALKDAHDHKVDSIICLGDLVGYGPEPRESVKLAKENCNAVLMGNHDAAVARVIGYWNFREEAQIGVKRHIQQLDKADIDYLGKLPYVHNGYSFAACHSTLENPQSFAYIYDVSDVVEALNAFSGKQRILFVGHSHATVAISYDRFTHVYKSLDTTKIKLEPYKQYLINVGSVGYPRNEPQTIYVLYDSKHRTIEWRKLPFDFKGYAQRMQAQNIQLPFWFDKRMAEASVE